MLNDVAGSLMFSTPSPDPLTSVFRENLLSSVDAMVDLPVLVFYGKYQPGSVVLGSEHRAHSSTSGPPATLIKSVSDRCIREHVTSVLLEVIL